MSVALKRERVIKRVDTLEDAKKVEETVKTGYCDAMADDLDLWIAVEEDLADSYRGLAEVEPEHSKKLLELFEESDATVKRLQGLLKSVQDLGKEGAKRIQRLSALRAS
jgi:hypothetical protein